MGDQTDTKQSQADERAEHWRRLMPPSNEIPVLLPWSGTLGRSEDIAVALVGAHLHSSGVLLYITARGRGAAVLGLHGAASGRFDANGDVLCLGVEMADGTAAANIDRAADAGSSNYPTLMRGGGGGGPSSVDVTYFLSPVPPPGPVCMVCAWPSRDIPETRSEFDGTHLTELLAQVTELWPPEPAGQLPDHPQPTLPPGGWFETYVTGSG